MMNTDMMSLFTMVRSTDVPQDKKKYGLDYFKKYIVIYCFLFFIYLSINFFYFFHLGVKHSPYANMPVNSFNVYLVY